MYFGIKVRFELIICLKMHVQFPEKKPPCIDLWETTAGKSLFSWLISELAAGAELVKERRQKEEEND